MAEASAVAASITGIVRFGLQLATTIQTFVESSFDTEELLRDIALEISSNASTLSQLQQILEGEEATGGPNQGPKVFKDEGVEQIELIVVQCDKVCKSVALFILKAGSGGGKSKLTKDTLDVQTFSASSLIKNLKWPWLRPRIKRCQEKLKWLNVHLLLFLQVANLVGLQIQKGGRFPGSFDEELAQRFLTEGLKQRSEKYTKKLALKFKKIDETKSCSDVDTISSVHSIFEDPPKHADPEPNAEENKKLNLPTNASGSTEPHSDSPANLKGDLKIDAVPIREAPVPGACNGDRPPWDLKVVQGSVTEPQKSDTLVGDVEEPNAYRPTVKDDADEETLNADNAGDKNPFIEEKTPPSPPAGRNGSLAQDIPSTKPALYKQTELAEDLKKEQELVDETEKKLAIASFPFFEPNSGVITSWLSRLFGKSDKFLHDWDSQALEAFVFHKDSTTPVKLPFGHQRLTFGLKQVMKTGNYLSWDQYLQLESQHHRAIDQIISDAKQSDSRQRTFLALVRKQSQNQDEDRILVFFSLGGLGEAANLTHTMGRKLGFSFGRRRTRELRTQIVELELAKLKAEVENPARAAEQARIEKMNVIKFKDAVGRRFSFPFNTVKTWAGMEELIRQAFLHVEVIGPHVAEGHYDLVGPRGEIILPQVWEAMVEPGWAVTMHMWPLPERPKPAPVLPPPGFGRRGPPPPPPPGWIGPPPPSQRRNGPPPPPPWVKRNDDDLIIIEDAPVTKPRKKKFFQRDRRSSTSSSSSDSSSYLSDSDSLVSDSEIEDDGLDEELQTGIDFEKEKVKADVPLEELLGLWTNAVDTGHQLIPKVVKAILDESDDESDSGSDDD